MSEDVNVKLEAAVIWIGELYKRIDELQSQAKTCVYHHANGVYTSSCKADHDESGLSYTAHYCANCGGKIVVHEKEWAERSY